MNTIRTIAAIFAFFMLVFTRRLWRRWWNGRGAPANNATTNRWHRA